MSVHIHEIVQVVVAMVKDTEILKSPTLLSWVLLLSFHLLHSEISEHFFSLDLLLERLGNGNRYESLVTNIMIILELNIIESVVYLGRQDRELTAPFVWELRGRGKFVRVE